MQPKLWLLLLAGVVAYGTVSVSAHHPFGETYREDQEITIKGVVVELVYRNPHSYIHVMAPDRNERMHRWAVEWGSQDQMRRHGLPEPALKPGDHVIATGSPGRDPAAWRLRLRTIVRPRDGWRWSGAGK